MSFGFGFGFPKRPRGGDAALLLALDQIGTPSAAAYSLRKLRAAYTGSAIRVRRSSDNAEQNIGFATAAQTRTNLAAIPINNNGGFTPPGVTMTTVGTGTEFGQSYIDVRWQGTVSGAGHSLEHIHSSGGALNPTIHASVTPGLTYTTSIGFRLVSGTAPSGSVIVRGIQRSNAGIYVSGATGTSMGALSSELRRGAVIAAASATAAYIQPSISMSVTNGEVVDVTIRFYAANVEQAVGNARPLLLRNTPETIAEIGDLDINALLAHVGSGNGFVTTWYDQSGNARNATQTTAGNQPQIVASGAVITEGGQPAIKYDGTSQRFDMPSIPFNMNAISVNVVAKLNNTGDSGILFSSPDPNRVYVPFFAGSSQSLNVGYATNATAFGFGGSNLTDRYLWQLNAGASTTNAWRNGVASTAVASSSAAETGNDINIGSYQAGGSTVSNFWNGTAQEVIFFTSALSTTDRQTLERNEGAYYGISFLALDQIGAPSAAAYSLRKLRAAYTGSAVRVRRSSDNTEANIGFASNGDLDTAALLTFVGAGNGFVTTWYDQSGNARNTTQATAGNQPQIVTDGVIETQNGRPALRFDGAQRMAASFSVAAPYENWFVLRINGMPGIYIVRDGIDETANRVLMVVNNNSLYIGSENGANLSPGTGFSFPYESPLIIGGRYNGSSSSIFVNGTVVATGTAGTVTTNGLTIGGRYNGASLNVNGFYAEHILINGVLSTTDRQTLERNEGAYYSITVL